MIQRKLLDKIQSESKPKLNKIYPQNTNSINESLVFIKQYLDRNSPSIALLGIGKDGHTAGIFQKKNTSSYCYLLKNRMDPYFRITISMDYLLRIPHIIFFVFGSEKKEILGNILSKNSNKRFIATKYLIKNGLGEKSIFCDKEAAPDRFKIGESIIKI